MSVGPYHRYVCESWKFYTRDVARLTGKKYPEKEPVINDEMETRPGVLTVENTNGTLERREVTILKKEDYAPQFKKSEALHNQIGHYGFVWIIAVIASVVFSFYAKRIPAVVCLLGAFSGLYKSDTLNTSHNEEIRKLAQLHAILAQHLFQSYVNRVEFKPTKEALIGAYSAPKFKEAILQAPNPSAEQLVLAVVRVFHDPEIVRIYAEEANSDELVAKKLEAEMPKGYLFLKDKG